MYYELKRENTDNLNYAFKNEQLFYFLRKAGLREK